MSDTTGPAPQLVDMPVEMVRNPEHDRFELWLTEPDRTFVGFVGYSVTEDGTVDLLHTVIGEQYGRQGYARTLVTLVLDSLEESGKRIRPTCSYVQDYLERFPQYRPLVA
ncbi:GNAT family N-acetyltransferase [Brevibacterium litoralis]|uniref:GNAT family N-acetyltransferase n=1 Tax=Brevibacterium litoralis TaxID=3138935 RepID=UPI0032EEE4A2